MLTIIICGILLVGCNVQTSQSIPRPATFSVAPDKARINVFRPKIFYGSGCSIKIQDNGNAIGYIGPGGRLTWDRPAGEMRLDARVVIWNSAFEPLLLSVKEGGVYNVVVDIQGIGDDNLFLAPNSGTALSP